MTSCKTPSFSRLAVGLCAALLAGAAAAPVFAETSGYAEVDPFIGTGPDGHTYPGATVPFGMVQLSPDTWVGDFHHSYAHAAATATRTGPSRASPTLTSRARATPTSATCW